MIKLRMDEAVGKNKYGKRFFSHGEPSLLGQVIRGHIAFRMTYESEESKEVSMKLAAVER